MILPSSVQRVLEQVCRAYGAVTPEDIRSDSQVRQVVVARHLCAYILVVKSKWGLHTVKQMLGYNNHSSVIYAVGRVERVLASDERAAEAVAAVSSVAAHIAGTDSRRWFAPPLPASDIIEVRQWRF